MDKNIDLRYFFINHYSSSGKLYAVEYKGNPLELQNAIKRLQEENEGLKSLNDFNVQKIEVLKEENEKLKKKKDEYYLINLDYETKISYLIQALEEIRNEIGDLKNINRLINLQKILDTIDEVLND